MPTILVTGASSGIGKATVELFAKKDWTVIATMRDPNAAKSFGWTPNIMVVPLDVTNQKTIETARRSVEKQFDSLDVLLNNAGYGLMGSIESCTEKQMMDQFDTNVFGLVRVTKEFLPLLKKSKQASIINISSIVGKMTMPYMGYYAASKHAVVALSEGLWYDLYHTNVRVKVIEPGATNTKFVERKTIGETHNSEDIRKKISWKGSPPTTIAKVIWKAANDRSHRLRYHAGQFSTSSLAARAILPDRLFMEMMRQVYKIEK